MLARSLLLSSKAPLGRSSPLPLSRFVRSESTTASVPAVAGTYKLINGTGMLLALAVPAAAVAPGVADVLLLAALPLHSQITMRHAVDDYFPNSLFAALAPNVMFVILLVGIARMIWSGEGLVKSVFYTLWSDEVPE
eukprot:TRINITY_DN10586_c0_g1_i1.p1 TRINITY_DN10586_c0_g1~~TRINITY_DN10586_c0_g1_i1.p1  ORF type:complete len:151 (+),score=49.37 TRINITY_DN10586_c0_g1_i1:44-454(+)